MNAHNNDYNDDNDEEDAGCIAINNAGNLCRLLCLDTKGWPTEMINLGWFV